MPTFELTKTIEAVKLNPRSRIPLPEPPVTIPYGALLNDVEWKRDLAEFTYLGKPYQCRERVLREALGEQAPKAKAAGDESQVLQEELAAEPGLRWIPLRSDHFHSVLRTKVPGGWLVATVLETSAGLTFYPDAGHEWDGSSEP